MQKRRWLGGAMLGALAGWGLLPALAAAQPGRKGATAAGPGPTLLTVSGRIGAGNRGAFDPALDQLMGKQKLRFDKAHAFDFAAIAALPAMTIRPTLEYDGKPHELSGPLLMDVMKACGVQATERTAFFVRAIDGFAAHLPAAEATRRRYIVATHLDGRPMALGGLGPLWTVYDADRFADMAARPLPDRFGSCPWATYHIDVKET
ncbi:MAG TPA: molybdopterin-dependent oxidoreductase [Caldimonas sp.]|jgi:hypothetical protein|nr:molybdopterin-dependent oxidoreductase [Caldimonas sp.]HEX2541072.1 molybdopterin-dependent oxidoreductase [Caldimonas sp.]